MSSSNTLLRTSPPSLDASRNAARSVPAARTRESWIDSAKGIGILLVVLGHCLRGMIDAGLFPNDGLANRFFYAIYTFHMPMFFYLSGLFVQRRLGADENGFLKSTMGRLLWPYVLWSVVQVTVVQAAGGLVNSPYAWGSISYLSVLWHPMSQYWFLYVLACYTVMSYLIVPRLGAQALVIAGVFLLGLREMIDLPFVPTLICMFAVMYALGVLAGSPKASPIDSEARGVSSATLAVISAASALVCLVCAHVLMRRGVDYWSVAALPAAVSGCVAFIGLARLPWVKDNAWLGLLGRQSMPIFLMHVLFVAGTRIILNKLFGLTNSAFILVVIVVIGVSGPLAVYWAAKRLRIAGWLGL